MGNAENLCGFLARSDSYAASLYRTLQYHLKENLFAKRGKLPNNFKTTISDADLQRKALLSFKDEYLLDYINIESPDDEWDERVLESEIMTNIKNALF